MAALTLEAAQRRLQLYLDAEEAILLGNQEVTVGPTTYKRADLPAIQRRIDQLYREIDRLEAGNPRGPVFRPARIIGP